MSKEERLFLLVGALVSVFLLVIPFAHFYIGLLKESLLIDLLVLFTYGRVAGSVCGAVVPSSPLIPPSFLRGVPAPRLFHIHSRESRAVAMS